MEEVKAAATVSIKTCSAARIFDDPVGERLMAEYAEECALALIGKPAPRLDLYASLEQTGMGQCFAAYEDDVLVGFAMLVTAVVPHYGLSCASFESLFVTREANCGKQLMDAIEAYARRRGCTGIFYTAPVNSRLARLLFLSSDIYKLTNHVFCRRLA